GCRLTVGRPVFIGRPVAIRRLMTCRLVVAIGHSARRLGAVSRRPSISAAPHAAVGRTVRVSITGRTRRSVVASVASASGVVAVRHAVVPWPHAARPVAGTRTVTWRGEAAIALLVATRAVIAGRLDVTLRAVVVGRGGAVTVGRRSAMAVGWRIAI